MIIFGFDSRDIFTALAVINAVVFFSMFSRAAYFLIRNHLQMRVRFLMWGSAIFTASQSWHYWNVAIDRVVRGAEGTLFYKIDPATTILSFTVATIGVFVLGVALEYAAVNGHVDDLPLASEADVIIDKGEAL